MPAQDQTPAHEQNGVQSSAGATAAFDAYLDRLRHYEGIYRSDTQRIPLQQWQEKMTAHADRVNMPVKVDKRRMYVNRARVRIRNAWRALRGEEQD